MESESDYLPLQQPGAGYNAQQAPASPYSLASGGSGSGAAQATKMYDLPTPETFVTSNKNRWPRVSTLPLYLKNTHLKYDQILQQGILNCFLAATLAAMANTTAGRRQITRMITQHKGVITTICKKFNNDGKVGPKERLKSNRWFTVSFKAKSVDVSDVLYHDDSDRNPNLIYMTTPYPDRALWGAIVEVAYAKLKGGYDNIGAGSITVNQFLADFSAVKWAILDPAKDKAAIKKACSNAGKRATFIATKSANTKILTSFHAYAVLGIRGAKIKLWEPMHGKEEEINLTDLLTEVQAVMRSP